MTETDPLVVEITAEYNVPLPKQAKQWDAGYDLESLEDYELIPGERYAFSTGIALAIPEGYAGFIKPRSGLAIRNGIDVLGGVIDSGYRGEVKVILLNTSDDDFTVAPGDRIAQLVIQPVARVEFHQVSELPLSDRREAGFGSTGVR